MVPQEQIPYYHVPLYGDDGRLIEDLVNHQDFVAWITQGVIPPRHREHLGESDRGVIFYRKLLMEQMDIVADGGEPMAVVRDEEVNKCIHLPLEKWPALSNPARMAKYAPSQAGQSPGAHRAARGVPPPLGGRTALAGSGGLLTGCRQHERGRR